MPGGDLLTFHATKLVRLWKIDVNYDHAPKHFFINDLGALCYVSYKC